MFASPALSTGTHDLARPAGVILASGTIFTRCANLALIDFGTALAVTSVALVTQALVPSDIVGAGGVLVAQSVVFTLIEILAALASSL